VTAISLIVFAASACLSAVIWVLGTGVSKNEHMAMSVVFIIVNAAAFWIIINPRPNKLWMGLVAAFLIVPIEILALLIAAGIGQAYK